MKYLALLFFASVALVGCGSDNNSSDRIHTTAFYAPTTDNTPLKDEHVVLITEEDNRNALLLFDSLSGEQRELSHPTHDTYKVPQALISADRKQVLYIANQDFKNKNDLYLAGTGVKSSQRLTEFSDNESVVAIETTAKSDEVLIHTKTLNNNLDNFYLLNLKTATKQTYIENVVTHNHFLSADNSRLYIMEDVPVEGYEHPLLYLYELDLSSGTKRFVLSVYESDLSWDSQLVSWINDQTAIMHQRHWGVIDTLNVSNGTVANIDEYSAQIINANPEGLLYLRSPNITSEFEGIIHHNFQDRETIHFINTSEVNYRLPPVMADNKIFYSNTPYYPHQTEHYIYDLTSQQAETISIIPESIFFYIADSKNGLVASYANPGHKVYLTDVAAMTTDAVEIPYPLKDIIGTFSNSGENFITAITAEENSHNGVILNINMDSQSTVQHELSEPTRILATCTTAGYSCYNLSPYKKVEPDY